MTISDAHVSALQSAVNEASDLMEACLVLIHAEARDPERWRSAVETLHAAALRQLRAASGVIDAIEVAA